MYDQHPMKFARPQLWHTLLLLLLPLITHLATAEEVRLSSLDLSLAKQGWGKPGVDRSVDGRPLRIAGHDYTHGFGTHAPGEVYIDLDG